MVLCSALEEHLDLLLALEKAAQETIARDAKLEVSLKEVGDTASAASHFAGAVVKLTASLSLLG